MQSVADADNKKPHPTCPSCLKPKNSPCGRSECPLRECLTVDIPDGWTVTGKIDTRTKEWQE